MKKIEKKCLKLFNKKEYKNPQIFKKDTENVITFQIENIYFPEEIIKYYINTENKTIQKISEVYCICQNCYTISKTELALDKTEKLDRYFAKYFNEKYL